MYLGIDVGTGALKAAIVHGDGEVVDSAETTYGEPALAAAAADFDPRRWWAAAERALAQLDRSHRRSVEALAVTGQMHSLVLVDGRGRLVRDAILWPDERAQGMLVDFARFEARHPEVLGNPLVPGMAGPVLAWLARHEPEVLRSARHALQPKDWLTSQLSGAEARTDASDASATLLFDVSKDRWSEAICREVGIDPSLLPPIVPSTDVAGSLSTTAAADLGLPVGIPVIVGAGDAPAALLGAGIEEPGVVLVNSGTGAQIMTPLQAPLGVAATGTGLHQYRSASDRTAWYAMAAVVNCGLALGWVRRSLGVEWDALYASAADALGSHAAADPQFLPFLGKERDPQLAGAGGGVWAGLRTEHDRESMVRSAVRGVAFYVARRSAPVLELAQATSVVMAGGSVRHHDWVQLLATALGRDLTVATDPHLTVRGAAELAARGLGHRLPAPSRGTAVQPLRNVDVDGAEARFEAAMRTHVPSFV